MLRTKEQYIEKLNKMKPNIYIGDQKVGRDDPRLRPGINVLSITFDLAQNPKYKKLATAKSNITGGEVNRWAHLPQDPYDLMEKQKLIRMGARRAGGCIQRCMGHDAISALSIYTKEVDEDKGTNYHERFLNFMKVYQENDLVGCCAQTDSKGDRLKRPSAQADPDAYVHIVEKRDDGIVVSGFKMSVTQAPYADEIFVIPTRALMEDDKDYAVAFVVPGDWEGVKLVTRPVWHRQKDDDNPPPICKTGISDSVVVFDNVFVPNERVFMAGEWEYGRRLALLFADSHRHSYSGCKPAVSDILCGTSLLAAEANNITKVSHVREKLTQFAGAAELAFSAGVAAAVFGKKTKSGTFFPNTIYANVGRKLMGELIYHEFNLLTEMAGGIASTLPFKESFTMDELKSHMEKFIVRNPKIPPELSLKIWNLVEIMSTSGMTAELLVGGVHGGGSPIMEAIALSLEYDFKTRVNVAKYLGGIDKDMDDDVDLETEPWMKLKFDDNDEK